jgi:hypothetical protein
MLSTIINQISIKEVNTENRRTPVEFILKVPKPMHTIHILHSNLILTLAD